MRDTYDIAIIGAGVMGASIAYHLAKQGAGRIVVLERGGVCSGNTRMSGALIRMHYTNTPEARMALASLPYFQHWAELVGGDCGFRRTGFALLVGPENVQRLRRNVARLVAIGVNTRVLGPDELRETQPSIDPEGVAAAAYEPDSGYADPVATTETFMRRAIGRGAELIDQTRVTAIETAGGRVTGLATTRGRIAATVVVCAANTWSPPLLRTAGVELGLWFRRGQMAFYRRPSALVGEPLVLIDTTTGSYVRPDGPEGLAGGMTALTGENPRDPDRYDEHIDDGFADEVRRQLAQRVPAIVQAPFSRGQVGLYDMSADTRAILDRAPGVEGLYLAAGFSGTGFKKAPAVGACMAELILEGAAKTVDLAPFRFTRFAEGAPIHGTDEYELPTDWGHSF